MQEIKTAKMVQEILNKTPLSKEVAKALLSVDREVFVPLGLKHLAFLLDALPLIKQQWISSPLTVAKMTEYLQTQGADSVLEIGCGSGYQAAVLSRLIRRVFSIERIEKLLLEARERFKTCGISNITTRFDDGQKGWKMYAPYDRILFSASTKAIPEVLVEQLANGGILVAPIEVNNQQLIKRFRKKEGVLDSGETLEVCTFVPVLGGIIK